jgi:hypothetical protein
MGNNTAFSKLKVTTLNGKELLKRESLAYRRILLFWTPCFSPSASARQILARRAKIAILTGAGKKTMNTYEKKVKMQKNNL